MAWKNHGAYKECVDSSLDTFEKKKLISEKAEKEINNAASKSSCGKKAKKDKTDKDDKEDNDNDKELEKDCKD